MRIEALRPPAPIVVKAATRPEAGERK
jgi:hypothetical protein